MTLYQEIARDAFPDGATLGCKNCGIVVDVTWANCAEYLAAGWPSHCGQTMLLKGKDLNSHGGNDL